MERFYNIKKLIQEKKKKIIFFLIILLILLIVGLIIFFKIYNEPSNKLKRTLEKDNYSCNKTICTKEKDNTTYNIAYKKDSFQVITNEYILNITKKGPYLVVQNNSYICEYKTSDKNNLTKLDEESTSNPKCSKYINEINNYIIKYQNILDDAKITISDLPNK